MVPPRRQRGHRVADDRGGEQPVELLADMTGLTAPAAACGLAWAAVFAHGTFAAASTVWGPVVSRASADGPPQVALTFDDAPEPGATERVLDALAELGVTAAFFVSEGHAERHPALLERMDAEGHVVGNRACADNSLALLRDTNYCHEEIRRTDHIVEQVIGHRPALLRPNSGIKTWHLMRAARRTGHTVVTWSRRASEGAAPVATRGDIIRVRVGATASADAALRLLVHALDEHGLSPRRLDALLGIPAYQEPEPAPMVKPEPQRRPSPLRRAA